MTVNKPSGQPVETELQSQRRKGLEAAMNHVKQSAWEKFRATENGKSCEVPFPSPADLNVKGKTEWTPGELRTAAEIFQSIVHRQLQKTITVNITQVTTVTPQAVPSAETHGAATGNPAEDTTEFELNIPGEKVSSPPAPQKKQPVEQSIEPKPKATTAPSAKKTPVPPAAKAGMFSRILQKLKLWKPTKGK